MHLLGGHVLAQALYWQAAGSEHKWTAASRTVWRHCGAVSISNSRRLCVHPVCRYEGPVFVPASPRRGPAVVTRPSPSMVDASRVPWADRLDNTMARSGNHAVERVLPQQQPSVQGHRSDVAMGSLARPAATTAPQGGVRPYYNEVLVRKVLEKGATVRGRLGAEGLQQKLVRRRSLHYTRHGSLISGCAEAAGRGSFSPSPSSSAVYLLKTYMSTLASFHVIVA